MTAQTTFRSLPGLLCLSLRIFCCLTIALMIAETAGGQVDANASAPSVKVDGDGTVHIPPQTVRDR
jgi:hypothetical protein